MTEPRRKCPRCGKRRTMQTAILWRRRAEDELRPVCGSCWVDLQLSIVAYNEALMTPGMRLTLVPTEEPTEES